MFRKVLNRIKKLFLYNPITQLSGEENIKFLTWAFGENFRSLTRRQCMDAWNYRHSNLFIVRRNGNVNSDIKKMIEIWGGKNERI